MKRVFCDSSSFACAFRTTGLKSFRVAAFFIASKFMPAALKISLVLVSLIQPSTLTRDILLSLATRSKFSTVIIPWEVARGMMTVENFDLVAKDNNMSRVNVEGWIRDTRTKEIFNAAGMNFDAMKKAATRKDFKPVVLKAHAKLELSQKTRFINSHNVVAKLEGSDPKLKDEYVIYTAHWDHLGIGLPNDKGDKIYNGALDNASGCAGLIEMARAF